MLLFFVSCTNNSRFEEVVKIREGGALAARTDFQKLLSLDNLNITETQLKEIKKVASNLPEIEKIASADLNLLAENVFEFTHYFLNEFSELGKMLSDIKRLFEELSHKLTKAAESFGMVSLLFKKMNFAKTQFPYFEQSNVNLDLIFTRYKLVFHGMSRFIRQCADYSG